MKNTGIEKKYFRDIVKFKVLSAEQIKKISHSNEDFKEQLILRNLRLVVLIAHEYRYLCKYCCGLSFFDLVQEGNIGLMKAANSYKIDKGCKFSIHAGRWIRNCIIRKVQRNRGVMIFPYCLQDDIVKILKVKNAFFSRNGEGITSVKLAEKTYFSEKKVVKLLDVSQKITGVVSLDAVINDRDNDNFLKFIEDTKTPVSYHTVEKKELVKAVESLLATLNRREEKIMRMVFGIGYYNDFNMQEIGNELGLSRERVRQIRNKCMVILRKRAKNLNLTEFLK